MIEIADQNLHAADAYGQPLGIECSCQRRALVPLADLAAHRGNMRRITELRFVCRQCGSRVYKAFLFLKRPPGRGLRRRQVLRRYMGPAARRPGCG
jgi:hypothetical protein